MQYIENTRFDKIMNIYNIYKRYLPEDVYTSMIDTETVETETGLVQKPLENRPTGCDFLDVFAKLVRQHGNLQAKQYARMMGIEAQALTKTMDVLTGMGAREWVCEYLRLASCELLERTHWSIGKVGKRLGFPSGSTFSQFFSRVQKYQPYEWRLLKQRGVSSTYHSKE